MITREEILDYLKELPYASYDYPFKDDFYSAVLRNKASGKWFGILLKAPLSYCKKQGISPTVADGAEVVNLKCPPDLQFFLLESFKGSVLPAYHMNKMHWISVVLGSDMPKEEIFKLIELSYDMVKKEQK